MDLEDFIVSNNILPLGSVVFMCSACPNMAGAGRTLLKRRIPERAEIFLANLQKYMLYVIPAIVVVIYLKGYYDMFSPKGPFVLSSVDDCESAWCWSQDMPWDLYLLYCGMTNQMKGGNNLGSSIFLLMSFGLLFTCNSRSLENIISYSWTERGAADKLS